MNQKAKVLTILNSVKGEGLSVFAINLAISLQQECKGGTVLLDLSFRDYFEQKIPRILGIDNIKSVEDFFNESTIIDAQFIKGYFYKHSSGIEVISGINEYSKIRFNDKDINELIKELSNINEYVIITLREFEKSSRFYSILDNSNLIFYIFSPNIISLSNVVKYTNYMYEKNYPPQMIKYILNKSGIKGGLKDKEAERYLKKYLDQSIFYKLPFDSNTILSSINVNKPVIKYSTNCDYSRKIIELAKNLNDESHKRGKDSLFFESDIARSENVKKVKREIKNDNKKKKIKKEKIENIKCIIHKRLVSELETKDIDITSDDPREKERLKVLVKKRIRKLMGEEANEISDRKERKILFDEIYNEAIGLGPLEKFLSNSDVTEIMVNNENTIYIEKNGKIELTNEKFLNKKQLYTIIERIVAPLGRRIDESSPMVDGRLEDGSRVNAIIPPLSLDGPAVTIRLFEEEKLMPKDLLRFGSATKEMLDFINVCVKCRKNILIMGGTGSGKTTLLNIVASYIPEDERIITIEDSAELQLPHEHWIRLESKPPNIEGGGEITIRQLIINSLRMRPDRIVVGECRGGEALDMLQAMNTGHDGSLTTIHANSPRDAISRLNTLVLMSGVDLPRAAVIEQIYAAIDIIIQVSRFSDGTRKIISINEVSNLENGKIKLNKLMGYEQKGIKENKVIGEFKSYGIKPNFSNEIKSKGIELDLKIFNEQIM
ncbi:MAG: ATPase, T2SS/T4P/T4SS family [Atribacterota bacterium]